MFTGGTTAATNRLSTTYRDMPLAISFPSLESSLSHFQRRAMLEMSNSLNSPNVNLIYFLCRSSPSLFLDTPYDYLNVCLFELTIYEYKYPYRYAFMYVSVYVYVLMRVDKFHRLY